MPGKRSSRGGVVAIQGNCSLRGRVEQGQGDPRGEGRGRGSTRKRDSLKGGVPGQKNF